MYTDHKAFWSPKFYSRYPALNAAVAVNEIQPMEATDEALEEAHQALHHIRVLTGWGDEEMAEMFDALNKLGHLARVNAVKVARYIG